LEFHLCKRLEEVKKCVVDGIDNLPPHQVSGGKSSAYHQIDLEQNLLDLNRQMEEHPYDVVLMLDVLEHSPVSLARILSWIRTPTGEN